MTSIDRQQMNGHNNMVRKSSGLVTEAIRDGAEDAKRAAEELSPAIRKAVSETVYSTAYCLSFGVSFAGLLAARIIPENSPIAQGIRHGHADAQRKVEEILPARKTSTTTATVHKKKKRVAAAAARRARGEVTATAARITEDTTLAHV